MSLPVELLDYIFQLTDEPLLILDFGHLMSKSTINTLICNISIKDELFKAQPNNVKRLELVEKYDKIFFDAEINEVSRYDWTGIANRFWLFGKTKTGIVNGTEIVDIGVSEEFIIKFRKYIL